MSYPLPTRFFVNMPRGPVALGAQAAQSPLPQDPQTGGPSLAYGPYFKTLAEVFLRNNAEALLSALESHLRHPVPLGSLRKLDVISEKHGAFYHVARLAVHFADECDQLAVNVAVRPEQKAFLERECQVLRELHRRFEALLLPHVCLELETVYDDGEGLRTPLKLFVAEWFKHYHEFHLSRPPRGGPLAIKVWDTEAGESFLNPSQTRSLYRQTAAILTTCLDGDTFEQIHPWHHAAGDFVVAREKGELRVRLITVRDYRAVPALGPEPEEKWLAMLHFFFNLTLRLRLDRLDGTGDYAWAPADCLAGTLQGFLEAWDAKSRRCLSLSLPPAREVQGFLEALPREQWRHIARMVLQDTRVEAGETDFLQRHLDEHIDSLVSVLEASQRAGAV